MGWLSSPKPPPPPDYTPIKEAYAELAAANREAARLQYDGMMKQIAEQKRAADMSLKEWRRQYDITRADTQPWRDATKWALAEIKAGLQSGAFDVEDWKGLEKWTGFDAKDLEKQPGYKFMLREGEKMIKRSANRRDGAGAYSGATLKRLSQHAIDHASTHYGRARAWALDDYRQRIQNQMTDYDRRQTGGIRRYELLSNLATRGASPVISALQLGNQQVQGMTNQMHAGVGQYGAASSALAAGQLGAANAMVGRANALVGAQERYNSLWSQHQMTGYGAKLGFLGNLFGAL